MNIAINGGYFEVFSRGGVTFEDIGTNIARMGNIIFAVHAIDMDIGGGWAINEPFVNVGQFVWHTAMVHDVDLAIYVSCVGYI